MKTVFYNGFKLSVKPQKLKIENMKRHKAILVAAGMVLAAVATSAQEAEPIPSVFGTGVDDNGELLAAETIDPHWKLVSSPDDDFPGPDVLTLKPGFPVGPWVAEGPDSKWVAPQSDQGKGNAPGVYVYRLEFDLSGFDPETAKLVGQWTADDTGPEIVLNGESTGLKTSTGFNALGGDFEITSGFVAGVNTIDFKAENGGDAANPTGIRITLSGTATPLPVQKVKSIPGLFNTGVDDDGNLLEAETLDPHWILEYSDDFDYEGPDTFTLKPGFPVGPWVEEGPDSRWIAPHPDQGTGNAPGDYLYRITFDLSEFDHETATITGKWSSDNGGPDVLLNDESTGIKTTSGFGGFTEFEITSGFVEGINTVDFKVNNAPPGINPTGVRVELNGTAKELPPKGTPPSITTQPIATTAPEGDSVSFRAAADGSRPLAYQWQLNGQDIADATGSTLKLESIESSDAGQYTLTVTNAAGEATSQAATLSVLDRVPGVFSTGVDDDGVTLFDDDLDLHYRIIVNADGDSDEAIVQDSFGFPIISGPWIANSETSLWIGPRFVTDQASGGDYTYRLEFDLSNFDPSQTVLLGQWTSDNAGLDIVLNGNSTGNTTTGNFGQLFDFKLTGGFVSGVNTLDFVLNNADPNGGYTGLRVENLRAGSVAVPDGTAPTIAELTTLPPTHEGGSATITVLVVGSPTLKYQWLLNGNAIAGATGPKLTLSDIRESADGDYQVVVSNDAGSVKSDVSTLEVLAGSADLAIELFNGLVVGGIVGKSYHVEYSDGDGWQTLFEGPFPSDPFFLADPESADKPDREYRVTPAE